MSSECRICGYNGSKRYVHSRSRENVADTSKIFARHICPSEPLVELEKLSQEEMGEILHKFDFDLTLYPVRCESCMKAISVTSLLEVYKLLVAEQYVAGGYKLDAIKPGEILRKIGVRSYVTKFSGEHKYELIPTWTPYFKRMCCFRSFLCPAVRPLSDIDLYSIPALTSDMGRTDESAPIIDADLAMAIAMEEDRYIDTASTDILMEGEEREGRMLMFAHSLHHSMVFDHPSFCHGRGSKLRRDADDINDELAGATEHDTAIDIEENKEIAQSLHDNFIPRVIEEISSYTGTYEHPESEESGTYVPDNIARAVAEQIKTENLQEIIPPNEILAGEHVRQEQNPAKISVRSKSTVEDLKKMLRRRR